jgi:outer membrane lipoprotein-sorting protein
VLKISHIKLIFVLSLFFCAASCKTKKEIAVATPIKEIDVKSAAYLLEKMYQNEARFETLSGKFSAEVTADGTTSSFKATLRIRKDSLIWISISPALGIEVARVIITKDSLKYMNRINASYFEGDHSYLSGLLNTEVDYSLFEAIFVGNSIEKFSAEDFRVIQEKNRILLSTHKKRLVKRNIKQQEKIERLEKKEKTEKAEKIEEKEKAGILASTAGKDSASYVQAIWLNENSYKIEEYRYRDVMPDKLLHIYYNNFLQVDSIMLPHEIKITLSGPQNGRVKINFSKIALNTDLSFPYTVPEKYERIN